MLYGRLRLETAVEFNSGYLFSSFKSLRSFSALVSMFFSFCFSSLAACFSLISRDFFFESQHQKHRVNKPMFAQVVPQPHPHPPNTHSLQQPQGQHIKGVGISKMIMYECSIHMDKIKYHIAVYTHILKENGDKIKVPRGALVHSTQ